MYANVQVKANTRVWSGSGPIAHYEYFPQMGEAGEVDLASGEATQAYSYDKVFKYRQGATFAFRTNGLLYVMNWNHGAM